MITQQYFKRWPICRWAQPAVAAALDLARDRQIDFTKIQRITIQTFHEACRLAGHAPQTTDQAQYSIAFPVAAAFVRGKIGLDEIDGAGLKDKTVLHLAQRIELVESVEFSAAFPSRRLSRVIVELENGRNLESPVTEPPGDPENPLSNNELIEKFQALATPVLGEGHAQAILSTVGPFDEPGFDLPALLCLLRQLR